MLTLDTPAFRLEFLDPNGDADRQGTRYVRGGYLWQAHDREGRPLFTGPSYPHPLPDVYDGQGAPEAFRAYDLHGDLPLNPLGDAVLVPGVGLLAPTPDENIFEVLDSPRWELTMDTDACRMSCGHAAGEYGYHLERVWNVENETLRSHTRIANTGTCPLRLQWFAHPFFPPMREGLNLDPGPGLSLPADSRVYHADAAARIQYQPGKRFPPQARFQLLTLRGAPSCEVSLAHPCRGRVRVSGDFPLSDLPIWSNHNTFSPEPYLDKVLAPAETLAWSLVYRLEPSETFL